MKNMIAVRALQRVLEPYDVAEQYDRCFDCGEWSGPAYARMRERAMERVARRFGMTLDELWGDLYEASIYNMAMIMRGRNK